MDIRLSSSNNSNCKSNMVRHIKKKRIFNKSISSGGQPMLMEHLFEWKKAFRMHYENIIKNKSYN
jgi:hypothetical protein